MIWSQLNLQDPAAPSMETLMEFHNMSMLTIMMIITYVIFTILTILDPVDPTIKLKHPHHHKLESVWTFLPGGILLTLAIPSLRLLYLLDEAIDPSYTIKITAHQWYWSYHYSDFEGLEFDSFMSPADTLTPGDMRLLEVDNRMVMPSNIETRLILTAADVLHAWTIPALGVKADAVPGRLNQIMMTPIKTGIYYGQCSEICGANHSFMPIALEVINFTDWKNWLTQINTPYPQKETPLITPLESESIMDASNMTK